MIYQISTKFNRKNIKLIKYITKGEWINIKKDIIKFIVLVIIIIGIIVYNFISYKNETQEFINYNLIVNEEIENQSVIENIKIEKIKVYVTGEVNNPGVKQLDEGSRIEDAINSSGGITALADISKVNLAYTLEDGQKLYIPNINDEIKNEYISQENGDGIIEETKGINKEIININKADIKDLTKLPGVGESLAQKIIDYRNENGKFKDVEELKNVTGIGEKKYEGLKEYILVR